MTEEHESMAEWDGVTKPESLSESALEARTNIIDAAKAAEWQDLITLVKTHPQFVNSPRPGGKALFAPLHHTAYNDAPEDVIGELVDLGGWRLLRNSRNERPVDVALRRGHHRIADVLEPRMKHRVPDQTVADLQRHFHGLMYARAADLIREEELRLPLLECLLELEKPTMWVSVPGMYGGFKFTLEADDQDSTVVAESWCRLVDGSGERHHVTTTGYQLLEAGLV